MSSETINHNSFHHHKKYMRGRDPQESYRVATPLELLFDLTFVICFGFAASQFAHALAEGHFASGLLGFSFASYGICIAWINFSWFASAYDTDDWIYRICTMTQMIGVLVLATGLPGMFAAMEKSYEVNNAVMVGGYIIMRVPMIFQWLRAAKEDPARRSTCLTYAAAIVISQIGWTARVFLDLSLFASSLFFIVLVITEFAGPYLAERKNSGTPWHVHHIVERYSLFAIIALGEGMVGTVAALSAIIEEQGWTVNTALVGVAGAGLTFMMWWIYFIVPSAQLMHKHRNRVFAWSFIQIITIISIVATGAGLHVAAYFLEDKAHIGSLATVLCVALPVGIFLLAIYYMYYCLTESFDRFHILLLSLTAIAFAITILAAANGVNMATCLVLLMLTSAITVVGYEIRGHKHQEKILAEVN